tara:strand:+ start:360 stop:848 length:489 start_codon:yes stop_codon:yes gene_type:complete
MNLYDIEQEYRLIELAIEDAEGEVTPELAERITINEGDRAAKISAYVHVIREREAAALACKLEVERLQGLARRHDRLADRLRAALHTVVEEHGPVRADTYTVTLRRSQYVDIADPRDLPCKWWHPDKVVEGKPNKAAINKALKAGEEVEGAELRERFKLVLK